MLDIDFEVPQRLLVPRYGVSESIGTPLRREEVYDDPLCEEDRFWCWLGDVLVKATVRDQFFKDFGHAAKSRVGAGDVGFVDRNLFGFAERGLLVCRLCTPACGVTNDNP